MPFIVIKLEHEIFRKPFDVSSYCLVQHTCLHTIQFRQVAVKHDSLPTDYVDALLDDFNV